MFLDEIFNFYDYYIMANQWLIHVKATAKKHRGMKFKDVLKQAKKTYKRKAASSKKVGKRRGTKKGRKGSRKKRGGNAGMHTHRAVAMDAAPVQSSGQLMCNK